MRAGVPRGPELGLVAADAGQMRWAQCITVQLREREAHSIYLETTVNTRENLSRNQITRASEPHTHTHLCAEPRYWLLYSSLRCAVGDLESEEKGARVIAVRVASP